MLVISNKIFVMWWAFSTRLAFVAYPQFSLEDWWVEVNILELVQAGVHSAVG